MDRGGPAIARRRQWKPAQGGAREPEPLPARRRVQLKQHEVRRLNDAVVALDMHSGLKYFFKKTDEGT
jgi:hypothetical protein